MKINKKFYKSKTLIAALLTTLIPAIFPDAQELIKEHPQYVMGFVTFVFGLLRFKTTEAIKVLK